MMEPRTLAPNLEKYRPAISASDGLLSFFEQYADVIVPEPNSGCWLWLGATTTGYGVIRRNYRCRLAHRVAYEATHGLGSAEHLVIRHACDVRCCVNPDHLLAGTHKDNTDDMIRRRRHVFGERHHEAVLTDAAARHIAEQVERGAFSIDIAEELGLPEGAVDRVARGDGWKHAVPQAPQRVPRKGERAGNARLSPGDVRRIRELLATGMRHEDIAALYPVGTSAISAISTGQTWGHLQ